MALDTDSANTNLSVFQLPLNLDRKINRCFRLKHQKMLLSYTNLPKLIIIQEGQYSLLVINMICCEVTRKNRFVLHRELTYSVTRVLILLFTQGQNALFSTSYGVKIFNCHCQNYPVSFYGGSRNDLTGKVILVTVVSYKSEPRPQKETRLLLRHFRRYFCNFAVSTPLIQYESSSSFGKIACFYLWKMRSLIKFLEKFININTLRLQLQTVVSAPY